MIETALNIYQKLNRVQSELKAPKGQYNNFGKYKYRNAEDILEAVKPLNDKYGLVLTISDETQVESNGWTYIVANGVLVNVDKPEEIIKVTGRAREAQTKKGMDDSQITGATSSYARKYMLNGLYLIDDTKDTDTDQYHNQQQATTNQQQSQPNKQQAEDTPPTYEEWVNSSYESLSELTGWDKEEITVMLEGKAGGPLRGLERNRVVAVINESIAELKRQQRTQSKANSSLNKALQDTRDKFDYEQQAPQNNFKWGQQ